MVRDSASLSRRIFTFVAALALVVAAASSVAGQMDAVALQVKLERGETLYYHVTLSRDGSESFGGYRMPLTYTEEGRLAIRVLGVTPDGATVEAVGEDLHGTLWGVGRDWIGAPAVLTIRPSGPFVQLHTLEFPVLQAMEFPLRPVHVGESWGTPFSVSYLGHPFEVKPVFTLASVDRTDAGQVAHIRARFEGTLKNPNPPSTQNLRKEFSGTVRGVADDVWSVERGRLLQRMAETTINIQSALVNPEGRRIMPDDTTIHVAVRLEALPQDQVVVAAISPDVLIVPGKAVGAFALAQRMDGLVRTLGSPNPDTSLPDATMSGVGRGFRAAAASWPDRFIAYVDPQDRSTVLGFGVADRRFRTDKGVGVNSSEGAVLFAHGMSPARLTMASGSGTPDPIQLLIYNDQGIAYAITAQPTQSTAVTRRRPVGAVRWIAVFPPGSAGKIFALP